ncbi:MAG: S-layer homology domain-containing protein, partial [Candidatus Gracilibacteria bacterium]|nr:S-layer homology domain-containing protein [Candidatus Gracilibacteria bacterium]
NNGTTPLFEIEVDDIIDSNTENLDNFTFLNCGASYTNSSAGSMVNIDDLIIQVGTNCVITYTVNVLSSAITGTTIDNEVDISQNGTLIISPKSDTLIVGPVPLLDTSTKTDDDADDFVQPAQTVTYTVAIKNTGNLTGTGVSLSDTIDPNTENARNSTFSNCGTSLLNTTLSPNISVLNLEVAPAIDCVMTYQVTVKNSVVDGTIITNQVNISPAIEGGTGASPQSDDLTVVTTPILIVDKSENDADNQVNIGDTVTYTLTINNVGPKTGSGIGGYDTIDTHFDAPTGITFTSCGTAPSSTFAAPALSLSNISISSGTTCTIQYSMTVISGNSGDILDNFADIGPAVQGGNDPIGVMADTLLIPGGRRADRCGDGILQSGEQCDDGNKTSGDGCSSSCIIEGGGGGGGGTPPPPPEFLAPDECTPLEFGDHAPSCLLLDPDRPLNFVDVSFEGNVNNNILTLKNTKIADYGDYIFSGNSNHSSGKEEGKYASGDWEFQPNRLVTRVEVVKAALISNCNPIELVIPVPEDGFRFTDLPVDVSPRDEVTHFAARVMYTAYKRGIIKGNPDGSGKPFEFAKNSEILTILFGAAQAIPKEFGKGHSGLWYEKYTSFALENEFYKDLQFSPDNTMTRRDFAQILMRSMTYNPNSQISGYIERVNVRRQQEAGLLPIPTVESYESGLEACDFCLEHDPGRQLRFTDIAGHWAEAFIEILRTSKSISQGDYIASGYGNPSTGRGEERWATGDWAFEPEFSATHLELAKTAFISNCIPIP